MTLERITEIRARLAARSRGTWMACIFPDSPTTGGPFATLVGPPQVFRDKSPGFLPEDAVFIAHTVTDITDLLADRETLLARIEALEASRGG